MFSQIDWSWVAVFESIAAAWIFVAAIKIISCRISSFLGIYYHIDKDNKPEFSTDFHVRYVLSSFIMPVPTMSIRIDRIGLKERDTSDWHGKFISDILNPFYFRGTYIIKDREIANKPGKDRDGWHEIHLLHLPHYQRRIALNLHYITVTKEGIQQWATNDGYLIERRKRFWPFSFN